MKKYCSFTEWNCQATNNYIGCSIVEEGEQKTPNGIIVPVPSKREKDPKYRIETVPQDEDKFQVGDIIYVYYLDRQPIKTAPGERFLYFIKRENILAVLWRNNGKN